MCNSYAFYAVKNINADESPVTSFLYCLTYVSYSDALPQLLTSGIFPFYKQVSMWDLKGKGSR